MSRLLDRMGFRGLFHGRTSELAPSVPSAPAKQSHSSPSNGWPAALQPRTRNGAPPSAEGSATAGVGDSSRPRQTLAALMAAESGRQLTSARPTTLPPRHGREPVTLGNESHQFRPARDAGEVQPSYLDELGRDKRSKIPQLLPSAGDLSDSRLEKLSPYLQSHAVARTNQFTALGEHMGAIAMGILGENKISKGVCAGASTVWMRLHHTQPAAAAPHRVDTAMSYEGITHAIVYQNLYSANIDFTFSEKVRSAKRREYKHPGILSLHAQQPMDDMLGIEHRWSPNHTIDATAKAMADLDGYASLSYGYKDKKGGRHGHQMAMFRHPDTGRISFFDPNLGEFNLPSDEALNFLKALTASQVDGKLLRFDISPVNIGGSIDATPLSPLGDDLRRRTNGR